jgi:subtilisin family serine protease
LPPDVDPIITPSGSFGQVLEASIAACATSLEYLTYLRERLDVNIRVVTFEVYADCQIGECTSTLGRFDAAVTAAWNAGIFIVSSAGNNYCEPGGDSTVISVASRPFVCAVADLNMMNQLSPISSCGATSTGDPCDFAKSTSPSDITICAPGSQIVNAVSPTFADPGFTSGAPATSEFVDSYSAFACGTSYSAPHVAGVAALLFSYAARPGAVVAANYQALTDTVANEADGVAIWQILCRSADPLGPVEHFGSGRVNAYRALLELRGQPNLPGDLNDDGLVNSADTAVLSAWLAGNGAGSTPQCLMDVDADGDIDSVDLKALKSYVNQGFPDLLVRENCF